MSEQDNQKPEQPVPPPQAPESGMQHLGDLAQSFIDKYLTDKGLTRVPADPSKPARPRDAAPDDGFPYCACCKGWRRILNVGLPYEDPRFGTHTPCPECHAAITESRRLEKATARLSALRETSALGRFMDCTFERFALGMVPYQGVAYERALEFARQPRGCLTLTGPMGTGKTHLAAAIALSIAEREEVLFYTAPELIEAIYKRFGRRTPGAEEDDAGLFTDDLKTAPLLVLDELGADSGTPDIRMRLYDILGSRYDAQRATVIVSNLSVSQLRDADPRLFSRLSDLHRSVLVTIMGTDRRSTKRPEEGQRFVAGRPVDRWYKAGSVLVCPTCGSRPCVPACPAPRVPQEPNPGGGAV